MVGNTFVVGTFSEPASVTIEPGTRIEVGSALQIQIGASDAQGRLIAQGTAQEPIVFTSESLTPQAGDWFGLYLRDGTTLDSVISNVEVEYAGRSSWGGIYLEKADTPIQDVVIRDSEAYGVYAINASPPLARVTVERAGREGIYFRTTTGNRNPTCDSCTVVDPTFYGILVSGPVSAEIRNSNVDHGIFFTEAAGEAIVQDTVMNDVAFYPLHIGAKSVGSLTGNTFNDAGPDTAIELWGENIDIDQTWMPLGLPYKLDAGTISVRRNGSELATLTLMPGVELRFDPSTRLEVGDGFSRGSLIAAGTPLNPVRFTTSNPVPAPGQWGGIFFNGSADDATAVLSHCVVEYGGASVSGMLQIGSSSPRIEHCTIQHSSTDGIYLSGSDSQVRFNQIRDNAAYGVSGVSVGWRAKVHHNNFSGNQSGAVERASGSVVDARYNYFGDASGPSGGGAGTGQAITGFVAHIPWLEAPFSDDNYVEELFVSTGTFAPGTLTRFDGEIFQDSSWTLELYDSADTLVRSIAGSGTTVQTAWDGADDAALPLVDGTYRYRFSASSNATSQVATSLAGRVNLDATFARGELQTPAHLQTLAVGDVVPITGTADGANFSTYRLQYGSSLYPLSFSEFVFTGAPVTDGLLGNWSTAGLGSGIYRLRMLVENDLGEVTVVGLGTFVLGVDMLTASTVAFSPNGDGVQDEVRLDATLTSPAQWTIDVVDVVTGLPVKTFSGSGNALTETWDGTLADGVTVAPEGEYRFDLVAMDGGETVAQSTATTVLDLTPPTAAIIDPTALQDVAMNVDIVGDAMDPDGRFSEYVLEYGIGSSPLTYTAIASSFAEVASDLLGTWITNDTGTSELVNGGYQLRLRALDSAGNTATSSVDVNVDNLVIGTVRVSAETLDTRAGESVDVEFAINKPADVTLTIHNEDPGVAGPVLRTITGSFAPGSHAFTWDGRDDQGDKLPDEAYVYVLSADSGSGRTDQYAPTDLQGEGAGGGFVDGSYDPYRNDFWRMTFDNFTKARVTMQVTPTGGQVFDVFSAEPHLPGPFPIEWDGRDPSGQIVATSSDVYFPVPRNLRPNSIILTGDSPKASEITADPHRLYMPFGQVSFLSFNLEQSADVSVTILPPGVADPNDPSGTLLVDNQSLPAGVFEVLWDPRDATDANGTMFQYNDDGAYTFVIEMTNPETGTTRLRRGVVMMFR